MMYSIHVRSAHIERARQIAGNLTLAEAEDIFFLIKADHEDGCIVLLKQEVVELIETPIMVKGN